MEYIANPVNMHNCVITGAAKSFRKMIIGNVSLLNSVINTNEKVYALISSNQFLGKSCLIKKLTENIDETLTKFVQRKRPKSCYCFFNNKKWVAPGPGRESTLDTAVTLTILGSQQKMGRLSEARSQVETDVTRSPKYNQQVV